MMKTQSFYNKPNSKLPLFAAATVRITGLAAALLLSGCVVAPAPGYYAAPAYGPPAYYASPYYAYGASPYYGYGYGYGYGRWGRY